jgi:hypothetical protein
MSDKWEYQLMTLANKMFRDGDTPAIQGALNGAGEQRVGTHFRVQSPRIRLLRLQAAERLIFENWIRKPNIPQVVCSSDSDCCAVRRVDPLGR